MSEFRNEKECLIKSGSLIKIEGIKRINEKFYIVNMRIIPFGWKGLADYIERDFIGEELNLMQIDMFNIDIEDITYITNTLVKNQCITSLNLSWNSIGFGKVEILKIFSDVLLKNA